MGILAGLSMFGQCASAAQVFDCVIQPRQVVEVRSTVEGLIEKVLVDRGDRVTKGQTVVEIDSGVERATADLALARSELKGAVRSAEGRLEFATLKSFRRDELYREDLVSAQDRDEANTEKRLAEAELLEASDNKRIARIEYQRAMEQLRLRTLKSPFNGVVTDRHMHPGAVAETGENRRPILKLADIDILYVEVLMPIEHFRQVKVGMPVAVHPDKPLGGNYAAKVTVIDRVLDAPSGTFGVRLELPNSDRALPAGIRCKAEFATLPGR